MEAFGKHLKAVIVAGTRARPFLHVGLCAGVLGLVLGYGIGVARQPAPPVDILLQSGETVLGQPIRYPDGTPMVTAVVVTLLPGDETGWHSHGVPLFGWMLEGELTVDYGDFGTRQYKEGDALLEAVALRHNGRNTGNGPMRILAVFMGGEGAQNSITAD